jgi:proteasome accessory factor C
MAQRPATERLRRLLIILPWLMERGEVSVDEVAERFSVGVDDLIRDLELVSMCGLPPFVDEMIDVFIDEGMIFVGIPRLFTRPLQLSEVEAFELLAAGRAAMQLPGADSDGALARGLGKIAMGLGEDDTGLLVVAPTPAIVQELSQAIENRQRIEVRYQSSKDVVPTDRLLEPFVVFSSQGNWYTHAHDVSADGLRTFRIDRIESLMVIGQAENEVPDSMPEPGIWFADAEIERVTLRVAPSGRWIYERYPVDEVSSSDADGWVEVRLAVTSRQWLERLLLRLGDAVEVVDPSSMRVARSEAAARVLGRYSVKG